jgi:hypothetical protein
MLIINPSREVVAIPLVLSNGKKDSINIQPGGRAKPPAGAIIDPDKERVILSVVRVHKNS